METKWYYAIDKKPVGPLNENEFLQLIGNGTIAAETLVWQPGMTEWKSLSEISLPEPGENAQADEKSDAENTPVSLAPEEIETEYEPVDDVENCSRCGKEISKSELIYLNGQQLCPSCNTGLFKKPEEETKPTEEMIYADFWIRAGAKIIDVLILWAIGILVTIFLGFFMSPVQYSEDSMAFPILANMFQLIIAVSYTTYFLGKYAATPGKMVCHLKVVTPGGGKVSYHQACLRYFAEIVSSLIFCIGYLMAIFDAERRTLHDRMAGTRVIKYPR